MRPRLQEKRKIAGPILVIVALLCAWGWIGNDILLQYENEKPSASRGSRVNGYLVNGKRLKTTGPNFETYSRFGSTMGRTCVNHRVRSAIYDAYDAVYEEDPALLFTYGETGWCSGGEFWPHRTHQHGLSVDFMVPVRRKGRIAKHPTTVFDGFGYENDFDENGKMGEYTIDFDAMALHLHELRKAARKNDLEIERVIFAPELQKHLFDAKRGRRVKRRINFTTKPVWVRHDDHYHVDFRVKR
jgi:penicillin-insensitive murein endopeptidase